MVKKTRVNKRLQSCPGISEPSASGRIMRRLPQIWKQEEKPKPIASECDGMVAGLPPTLDSTFNVPKEEGKCLVLFPFPKILSTTSFKRTRQKWA